MAPLHVAMKMANIEIINLLQKNEKFDLDIKDAVLHHL